MKEEYIVNAADSKWEPARIDRKSITVREDTQSADRIAGTLPAYVFPPHWHDANERSFWLEGQDGVGRSGSNKLLNPGGTLIFPRAKCSG